MSLADRIDLDDMVLWKAERYCEWGFTESEAIVLATTKLNVASVKMALDDGCPRDLLLEIFA